MTRPEPIFLPDDFDRIYLKYFKRLKDENKLRHDPSGWLNTASAASEQYLQFDMSKHKSVVPYYSDYYDQLYTYKQPISRLLSAWDDYTYGLEEFTLCSSVTLGSLSVLAMFARQNIKMIYFETPAFYASISQAKSLGLAYTLMPTYEDDGFSLDLDIKQMEVQAPYVIWMTQPRMSLGINQNIDFIRDLYVKIPSNCYIVIDEASEQLFPSCLSELTPNKYNRIIKLRNIYKGLGINGVRMSYIAHHGKCRENIQREIENFQGAVDYFSLIHTRNWSENIDQFRLMSEIANAQTKNLRISLSQKFNNEFILFSNLVNGYVGSFSVDLSQFPFGYRKNREELLKYCYDNGVSIIVGATMKFVYHEQKEFIRLNYFKPRPAIEDAVEIIRSYLER